MARVLLGDFAVMVRAGLLALLAEERAHVVQAADQDVPAQVALRRPDVVVLDLDGGHVGALARYLCERHPAVTVVACSSARPAMRVFPPFHHGESYTRPLDPEALRALVRG